MLLADFGTSYTKILRTESGEPPRIIATRELDRSFRADLATGHNAKRRAKKALMNSQRWPEVARGLFPNRTSCCSTAAVAI